MNNQELEIRNSLDGNGNPAGGYVKGKGLNINWQDGPLQRGGERLEPNGTFVETVTRAVVARMEFYQATKFACGDNAEAIEHLKRAIECFQRRTKKREEQGVEGTHGAHTE